MRTSEQNGNARWTRVGLYGLVVLATVIVLILPYRNAALRAVIMVGLLTIWAGALGLFWKWTPLRIIALLFVLPPLLVALAPDRQYDGEALAAEYVHCLQRFVGKKYVNGGETHLGVDSSGLLRAGLIDAEIEIGVKSANPRLLRHAAALWWNGCDATALAREFQNRTVHTVEVPSLEKADYARIRPGDLAITNDGRYALSYVGERRWIESNPDTGRVALITLPGNGPEFESPAQLVRWRILDYP